MACAALAVYVLGSMLAPSSRSLPGNDSVNLYAWESFTRDALATGRLPLWNPFLLAGTPHLADTQTTVLYPVALALRWLPTVSFFSWMVAVHLIIAAAGGLFLARVVGLGWLSATCVALAVMIGGNAGPWLQNGHLLLIFTVAWLPWVMGLAVMAVRRTDVMPSAALVVVLVLQFLAGYLQGSLYIVGAVCLYFLFSVIWPEQPRRGAARWRPLLQLTIVGLFTIGVAAFQLFPTARLTAEAGRTAGLAYRVAVDGAWVPRDLSRMLFPFLFVDASPPYRYLADGSVYVGWLLTVLAPFALLGRRRFAVFFATLGFVALAFALGDGLPFYRWHHALMPGLRVPGRLLFLVTLATAMLGGLGLEQFVECCRLRRWRPVLVMLAVMGVGMGAAASVALAAPRVAGVPPVAGWPWVPIAPLASLVIAGLAASGGRPTAARIVVLSVVAFDLMLFFVPAIRPVSVDSVHDVRAALGPPRPGRAISVCERAIDAKNLLVGRQGSLDGIGGMYLHDFADWANLAKSGDPGPLNEPLGRLSSDGPFPARRDLLDQANVTTVFACAPLTMSSLTPAEKAGPLYVYQSVSAWPRAIWTCGAEELTRPDLVAALRQARYNDAGRLVRPHTVNVRWAPGVTDAERVAKEERYHLRDGVPREERTWRYDWGDPSPDTGIALINDPSVEDTHGLDRTTGMFSEQAAAHAAGHGAVELLVGTTDCRDHGLVTTTVRDQVDGHVAVDVDAPVDGLVFMSEPYFPERKALVDGRRVAVRRANIAFVAVPVPAGRHHVELVLVPRSFYAGLGTTGGTLIFWVWLSRRRRPGTFRADSRSMTASA